MARLFVYGTLLEGEPGHHRLGGRRPRSRAVTAAAYELVHLGDYPGLVEGGHRAVVGELYDVDEALLAELDDYEGHPELFRRTTVRLSTGEEVIGYVYPRPRAQDAPRLPGGDWRARFETPGVDVSE